MRFSSILAVCSIAASASALPALINLPALASKTSMLMNGHCDVSQVSQPQSALPVPASGLKLAMIAIGRGTQNYTCPTVPNATAAPTAVGAVAKLFDFSCMAAYTNADQMGNLTAGMETVDRNDRILAAIPSTGVHYFSNSTTPTFALNNALGTVHMMKANATAAPTSAKNAVPWLKLNAVAGQDSPVQEVYRLETANGSAPTACGSQTGTFTVEYAAEYWFYTVDSFNW